MDVGGSAKPVAAQGDRPNGTALMMFPNRPAVRLRQALGLLALATMMLSCAASTPVAAPPVAKVPLPPPQITPYRLQVGDEISVLFWGSPELDQDLLIRPDGAISLPFVDEVQAAGLTPAELDRQLSELYLAELATPEITVIVRDVGGQEIFIGGEVDSPGSFPIRGTLTLYQSIQQAGGFLDSARRSEVVLIRTLPSGERIAASVNVMGMVTGKNPQTDIRLQAADIIFVPRVKILNFSLFLERFFYDLLPIRLVGTIPLFDGEDALFE